MHYGRIWPSSALRRRRGAKGSKSCWRSSQGRRFALAGRCPRQPAVLATQLQAVQTMIGSIEKRIVAQHRSNEASKRLETIPGIGVIGATTIAAIVPDPKVFRSGRDFAAWIGIVPRQDSTGGKQKLGPISKQGDQYLQTHSGCRSPCGLAACAPAAREVSLAHSASRSATVQGRRGRAGQQDGADRLGIAGQGRDLPSAPTRGSLIRSPAMGG